MSKRTAPLPTPPASDRESLKAEENFLFDTQVEMQRLLNEKGFKYKDLALGMGVSEARISQLFGDDNSNLTIRTIARVYHQLGEVPVLLTERTLKKCLAEAGGLTMPSGGWFFATEDGEFALERGFEVVSSFHEPAPRERKPTSEDWIAAEGRLNARSYAA